MKRPRVLKFPKPRLSDQSGFVATLVWLLNRARKGEIIGFAMVYVVVEPTGDIKTVEGAKALRPADRHHVLGAIRRMEFKYMQREWPEE